MAKVERILIVAITRLGDMLQASPTIAGLKRRYPGAKVTVAIERNFASVCDGIPGIDETFEIDLTMVSQALTREGEGIVEAYRYLDRLIDELRGRKFDFCLNMSSSGYTALLLRMLNIPDMRGWVSDDEGHRLILDPWAMLFSAFVYHSNRDYNSINLVDIFRASTGVNEHPLSLQYAVPPEREGFAEEFFRRENVTGTGPVIAIQAGASQAKRQWSPPRFAFVAKMLVEALDARIIFTGTKSEARIVNSILSCYSHTNLVSAVGKTDLVELGALLKSSDVLITGDTGTMHLSVAVGTPVVALFLASALCYETGPYSAGNIVLQPQISCNPCNPNLPCSRPDCHDQITPELVVDLVQRRLNFDTETLLREPYVTPLADPAEVAVFVTTFDQDRFLEFRPINGLSPKNGFDAEYYESARRAYRTLWKHEFAQAPIRERISSELNVASPYAIERNEAARRAIALSSECRARLRRLIELIEDETSDPKLLGTTTQEINALEREIEGVGLGSAVFGAIVRMCIMERENLRGTDARAIALATIAIYETFERRIELFRQLSLFHLEQIRGIPTMPAAHQKTQEQSLW